MIRDVDISIRVNLDPQAVAALNDANGPVGRGATRAGEKLAQRIRDKIVAYDLVDTGEMLDDVQSFTAEANADGVTVSAGTPNVEYTLYQREPFLLEALGESTVGDWDE